MKYCVIKQDTYQDLYITNNEKSNNEKLFSSIMRVGPFGFIYNKNADFFIIKEEYTEECGIYKHFLKGFGGNYQMVKSKTLNEIPGNEFFSPGTNEPNETYSKSCDEINWNNYNIVISINFSVPTRITKQYPNVLWCYYIGENNLHLLDSPKYNYDVALNQDISVDSNRLSNCISMPYTFLEKDTLQNIMESELESIKPSSGIFVEVNSCRGRPVTNHPYVFSILREKHAIPIFIHHQNIKENLTRLYHSKYFVKNCGRPIRGNSVIEAISCNCLVIMNQKKLGYTCLIPDECHVENDEQIIDKIEQLENNDELYQKLLEKQKQLVQTYIYQKPLHSIEHLYYKKNSTCVAFVCDDRYFHNFLTSVYQLIEIGKYYGPILLLASEELVNNSEFMNHDIFKKYTIEVYKFKNIKKQLSQSIQDFYIKHRNIGRKNYDWSFGTFNKFNLFHSALKKYKYILYMDCGIKVHKPIYPMFDIKKENQILAHEDDYPKYHYNLKSKFYQEEPALEELSKIVDLSTYNYFQTTVMLYDTSIIQDNTLQDICNLVEKYPISMNGDQEYISIYFNQLKKQMFQLTLHTNNNYYYDYFQRHGVGKYIMSKR